MLDHHRLHPAVSTLVLLLVPALLPGGLAAQACLGGGLQSGTGPKSTLSAGLGVFDGGRTFAADYTSFHGDPIAVSLGVGGGDYDGLDNASVFFGGQVAAQLPVPTVGICPVVGVTYERWSDDFMDWGRPVDVSASRIVVPVGLGVGAAIRGEADVAFIPAVRAGLMWTRISFAGSSGSTTVRENESTTDFFVGGGATLMVSRFFVQGSVARRLEDGAEAVFGLGLGVAF
jgi:hypothetical protein